jgi:crossover junction endodeoxyribonuclease RusA
MAITITLPWPPSVNRIWRHSGKKVYRDPKYMEWRKQAGWQMKLNGSYNRLDGYFSATLVLSPPDKRRRDLDNVIKPIFDLLQDLQWIKNDYLCEDLHVKWNRTLPVGVIVTLETIPGSCQDDRLVKE